MYSSIHTYSFRRHFADGTHDFYSAVDWAAEHGFHAMEFMVGNGMKAQPEAGLPDVQGTTVLRAVEYAHRRGVRITSFSTYNDFGAPDDETRGRHLAFIREWIGRAREAGVPYLRFLTGYYREGHDRSWQEARTADGIREVVEVARQAGIGLSTENHNTIFLSADELVALVQEHGPTLSLCPDPTNWVRRFYEDEQSPREVAYRELVKVAPFATQSHLKVRGITAEGELTGLDLTRLLRIYHAAGYTGPIAFEAVTVDDGQPGDLLADLPRARQILEQRISQVLRETPVSAATP